MIFVMQEFFGVEGRVQEIAGTTGLKLISENDAWSVQIQITVFSLNFFGLMMLMVIGFVWLCWTDRKNLIRMALRNTVKTVETQTGLRGVQIEEIKDRCDELELFRAALIQGRTSPVDPGDVKSEDTVAGIPSAPSREEVMGSADPAQALMGVETQQTSSQSAGVGMQQIHNLPVRGRDYQTKEYGLWTVKDLQQELRSRQLRVSGLKADLIQRLRQADDCAAEPDELTPTRAQISWMRTIAARKNVSIGHDALTRRSAASRWIDMNK